MYKYVGLYCDFAGPSGIDDVLKLIIQAWCGKVFTICFVVH